jgi:hypothetical protein
MLKTNKILIKLVEDKEEEEVVVVVHPKILVNNFT